MSENVRQLALLEHAHTEAQEALADLKRQWREEDQAIARARQLVWAKHEQGARDRDAMRVQLGGQSLIEADARAAEEAADKGLAAADPTALKAGK